jgi:hypothetical protein
MRYQRLKDPLPFRNSEKRPVKTDIIWRRRSDELETVCVDRGYADINFATRIVRLAIGDEEFRARRAANSNLPHS